MSIKKRKGIAMIVLIDGIRYQLTTPRSEAALENAIESNCQHIFGPDSFYFDIKRKIKSKAGVVSIPDGYVIFFTSPKKARWAIIEVELASHSIFNHVVPQLSKFNSGIEDSSTKRKLVEILYDFFQDDEVLWARLKQTIKSGEVHKFISDLVSDKPLIVVVIDQKTEELNEALHGIRGDVKVVEFKTFRREDLSADVNAYMFEPLGSRPVIGPGPKPDGYSEFWAPIRKKGLFAGKPVPIGDEGWIDKGIRGIHILLELHNHACEVRLIFLGGDRLDRRKKIIALFPKTKYEYRLHESPKAAKVIFPVLDKGKKDREHWPEMRRKLTKLGEDIYNKINGADI